jgi:hypothetical protein
MLRYRKLLISIICIFIFGFTISSYAEEEIEDLIDIAESKGKIIANQKVKLSLLSRAERQLPLIFDQMRRCYGAALKVI